MSPVRPYNPEEDPDQGEVEALDKEIPPSPAQYDAWLAISQVMSQLEVAFDATTDIDGVLRALSGDIDAAVLTRARAALRRQNHAFGVIAFNLPAIAAEVAGMLNPENSEAYGSLVQQWYARICGARRSRNVGWQDLTSAVRRKR